MLTPESYGPRLALARFRPLRPLKRKALIASPVPNDGPDVAVLAFAYAGNFRLAHFVVATSTEPPTKLNLLLFAVTAFDTRSFPNGPIWVLCVGAFDQTDSAETAATFSSDWGMTVAAASLGGSLSDAKTDLAKTHLSLRDRSAAVARETVRQAFMARFAQSTLNVVDRTRLTFPAER